MIYAILTSLLCGIIIGIERRVKGKAAGLKTLALISLGSTLFTVISLSLGGDHTRIISNIVTGIGFLGAGCVFTAKDRVNGLTTAAVVWLVAALGIMCGVGWGAYAILVAIGVVLMLTVGAWLENQMFPQSPLAEASPLAESQPVAEARPQKQRILEVKLD